MTTHELGIEDPSPFLVAFIKFLLNYWQGEFSKICENSLQRCTTSFINTL
jgi:hypothetical protein